MPRLCGKVPFDAGAVLELALGGLSARPDAMEIVLEACRVALERGDGRAARRAIARALDHCGAPRPDELLGVATKALGARPPPTPAERVRVTTSAVAHLDRFDSTAADLRARWLALAADAAHDAGAFDAEARLRTRAGTP